MIFIQPFDEFKFCKSTVISFGNYIDLMFAFLAYSATGNFWPPIPVSDFLIILLQKFDTSSKERYKNDKNIILCWKARTKSKKKQKKKEKGRRTFYWPVMQHPPDLREAEK